jgi:hypothetical protein
MLIQLHPSRRASATNLPTAAVLGADAGLADRLTPLYANSFVYPGVHRSMSAQRTARHATPAQQTFSFSVAFSFCAFCASLWLNSLPVHCVHFCG